MKTLPIFGRVNKKNGVVVAYSLIDDSDYEKASRYRWYLIEGYPATVIIKENGKSSILYLHQLVMNTPKGKFTDHKNNVRLDNRKSELRIATPAQNVQNMRKTTNRKTSIFKGVYRKGSKWHATICHKNQSYNLGYFEDEIEAARAYNKKAKELFGKFACLNEIIQGVAA